MINTIKPFRVFQNLAGDTHAHLVIPTVSGIESQTIRAIETLLLIALARIVKVASILEIGTSMGYTSLHLAMNTPATISTLDNDPKPCVFEGTEWEPRIRRISCDVAKAVASPFDMVFCDCNYTLDLCREENRLAFACNPAVIAWHDFGNPNCEGQTQNILELSETMDIYHIPETLLCFWFADGRVL